MVFALTGMHVCPVIITSLWKPLTAYSQILVIYYFVKRAVNSLWLQHFCNRNFKILCTCITNVGPIYKIVVVRIFYLNFNLEMFHLK